MTSPTIKRAFLRYGGVPAPRKPDLPTDGRDRVVFCFAYGDKFTGDNHGEALMYARCAVVYMKGMGLGPYAEGEPSPAAVTEEARP